MAFVHNICTLKWCYFYVLRSYILLSCNFTFNSISSVLCFVSCNFPINLMEILVLDKLDRRNNNIIKNLLYGISPLLLNGKKLKWYHKCEVANTTFRGGGGNYLLFFIRPNFVPFPNTTWSYLAIIAKEHHLEWSGPT